MRRTEQRQVSTQESLAIERATHTPARADTFPQVRLKSIVLCVAAALSAYPYLIANAQDLPTNPQVVGGAATVTQSGNHQTVTQTTNRAIVNWGGFSIGANNSVNFIQPGSSSVILNRVVGNDPSSIFGSLTANGKVFLVNPNGIFFGAGSSIDTGGLVATTMSIRDNDFMSGYFNFERTGAGQVENAGLITIREGGYALLAADQVSNTATGVINAPKGSVALTSADRVTIETNQDGLVGFSVSGDSVRQVASVDNAGLISADGGRIMLSARGAQELTGMVVNNSGTIRAQTVEEQDGAIILSGSSGVTQSSGVLDASGSRGGNIQVTNQQGVAAVSGQLTATGSEDVGGRIVVAGQQTGLFANTDIDASGTQGGTVRVGGEYRGDAVEGITSQQTYVASSANIKADGTAGDGGSVVVWADDVTRYDGHISARGTGAGKGGDAEVSGKEVLAFNGTADLTSESGHFGELLLDPATITIIDAAAPATPTAPAQLDGELPEILAGEFAGATSTIASGSLEALGSAANVVLQATGQITLNDLADNVLSMQQISGSLTLHSTTTGGIVFNDLNDVIQTAGGNITLRADGSGLINIGSLSSNGGAISLQSAAGTTTSAINSGGGSINIDSGATLTTGTLTSANGNIDLDSVGNMTTGAISSGSGTVNATSGGTLTTGTVTTSNANVILASSGNMNLNNVNSGSGTINLASSGNIHIRNIDTSQTLSLNSGGAITQQAATRIAANTVSIVNASTVNLTQSNFANNLNANVNGSSFAYKDANALTVNNVTVNNGAGNASLSIETGSTMTVAGNVSVTGTGDATNKSAAVMNLRATGGNIIQNAGTQITATDNGAFINNTSQETHFAQVTLKADNGGVITRNVSANSLNGRAQVIVDGRLGVEATSGSITATAASQPGVSIFSKDGSITTTNATIQTTQTREVDGPQNSKANPNKVVENVGGISIDGGTLNLGRIESRSTATSGIALFGIATASRGNTTFNQLVNTNADAGISASTTGTNALVSTAGVGLLQTKALALTGDRDKGFFRVNTDISSLTVLGGKSVDLDNTAHGAGVLTISALGRISDATTDPNTNTEIPETDKPVGGVRIQSQNIELLSLENRSTNSYLFDGTQTNSIFYGGAVQQDLRLIANNITFIPGTIQTKAETLVQLRPLTNSRNMQLALANATIPANTTFYSGDQIVGFLNQFNPDSVMVIGGANAIDVYGGTNAYTGNITIGSSTALADQISLGDMTLRFITNGRVFNNFGSNTNIPATWNDGVLTFPPYSTSVICSFGQACIRNMTTGQIFIKDSLQQSDPGTTRNVVFQGTGSGLGGTEPTGNSATNTGGGGGDSGGGSSGGGGGGGSNNNDSGPGGSNAPSDNPGGGGNDTTTPDQSGTTQVTNNPGQGNGNPGGNPGGTTDPTTPGGTTNTGTPQDSSNPTGDTLAGGGSFSGNDGSTGNTGNTGSNTNTGSNNGGNTSNDNNNQNTGNNPSGGGTLSDGTTPGGNNNTQTGDSGNNNGFTGGGNNSNNDNTGTGSNNTNTAGTGGNGGTGGGTFSDGSGSTSGGTQVADGTIGGNGSNSGGFTGGGSNTSGTSGSGTSGSSSGGTFSDGSGSTSGGTQVADGSTGNTGSGSGGFTGGGSSSGSTSSSGTSGSSGGGTFSDGSGTTSGGTQIAGGSSGGSGSNTGGFTGGGASSGTTGSSGSAGSSGGGTFSDGSGTTSGGTQVAGGGTQGSGQTGSGQSGTSTSGSGQGSTTQTADAGGFAGGGSGTSGSQSAGSDSGGFVGGGASSTASSSGSGGSSGGATFSDGSGSGTSGGTMLADGGQSGGGQSTGQGTGSQGDSSSGQSGGDSGGFSGGASGAASGGSDDGSQTQTASNQQTGDSTTGDGDSVFGGGAAGGGSSDATQLAENTQEQSQDYPECGDEGQSVKQVSRAGQPNADIVQMKATGVRLRGDSGSLNQQRASCARATATN